MKTICILGNQLFESKFLSVKPGPDVLIFMREDRELCTHFRYHKHKIIFFLSAMRKYAEELRSVGYQVHYEKLGEAEGPFEKQLVGFLRQKKCLHVDMFEIEDKFFEKRIKETLAQKNILLHMIPSPMFLTSRAEFLNLVSSSKKPFMKAFYESQRKRLKILLNGKGLPQGGQWSFDEENRKALPRGHRSPSIPMYSSNSLDREVFALVDREFADHPGRSADFWLPTDRQGARNWAKDFFDKRFSLFGPYEDALSKDQEFLYHSILTPYLNTGLVTPKDCIIDALRTTKDKKIPMNSCEGFIRQVIGWREFIRGIYQNYSEVQEQSNFFGHQQKLNELWYSAKTGIEPLDDVIGKTLKFGYAHHIERLMVVGSLMLLLEIDPKDAHRWFMEMFIDSSDWVMGPNVYGMALFSDGGIFATKPYFCGSNYYKKMGPYKTGEWQEGVDGLYWQFIEKNKEFFRKNHRMSMMVKTVEKMPAAKKQRIYQKAQELREKLTRSP